MGMDLSGAGGTKRFNSTWWSLLLALAYDYGWKPAGTEPPRFFDPSTGELDEQVSLDPDEWDGTYFSNDGQYVTDEDAANIADALERALNDALDFDTDQKRREYDFDNPQDSMTRALIEKWGDVSVVKSGVSPRPLEYFSDGDKQHIEDFIGYCRAGGFVIV